MFRSTRLAAEARQLLARLDLLGAASSEGSEATDPETEQSEAEPEAELRDSQDLAEDEDVALRRHSLPPEEQNRSL